jgi:hypothetical protein
MLTGVTATSSSRYVAIDSQGVVYIRETKENQTIAMPLEGQPNLSNVWADAAGNIVAIGDLGQAFHFDGANWSKRDTETAARLRGIWGTAANQLFAAGEDGSVHAFDGTKWAIVVLPDGYPLTGLWGASATDVYAVGGRRILHYDGKSWRTVASGLTCGATAISGTGGAPQIATECGDTFHLRDSLWVRVPSPIGTRIIDLATVALGPTIWVANNGTVLTTQGK